MKTKLGTIQQTALIPLAVRARETENKGRVMDPKAAQILATLEVDAKKLDRLLTHESVVARTQLFDQGVRDALVERPQGPVLNLGCGLDDRFHRVDNGKVRWINMDLDDAIALRRMFFKESERETMQVCDLLKAGFTRDLPDAEEVIVVAEGLFMYFTHSEIRGILEEIIAKYPAGNLLVELMRKRVMHEKAHDTLRHTRARFGEGIDRSGRELEALVPALHFVGETTFSERMKSNGFVSRLLGTLIGENNNRLSVFNWTREE